MRQVCEASWRILVQPVPVSRSGRCLTLLVMTKHMNTAGSVHPSVRSPARSSSSPAPAAASGGPARLFAFEGAAVVLAARGANALGTIVKELRADGGIADAVTLDLADRAGIRAAVDRVEQLHGRLAGAFNR
ncbi:SDR family NAD(P)-dependent oxidoreductase [Streptomyces sp. NPDC101225]|uniref:SDR family NAD(P)-dependent oxidoreductase n=1 Tax=Streptomyces sp. NPDC101225 TaxID=3366135 RepID=UPI00380FB083